MAEIRLDGVRKEYPNGFQAVKSFDLHIRDGEFVVFVGPSGCGKSTTLRMIAGLEDISHGTLSIGSRIVNDLEPKERDIAMVFQSYALYPHMTVRENMGFALKLARSPKAQIEERVNEVACMLHLDHLLERRPRELSGGQRQRVALGRAIVRKPQAFLMDEPLSNLDAKLRVEMRASISRLHQQLGVTTVYVTHDQVEAMTMGSRIVVMKDGVIQQVADPIHLYENPANRFVASFIGSPAMNFLPGQIEAGRVSTPQYSFSPEGALSSVLKEQSGREVLVGFRPEDLRLTPEASSGCNCLRAQVDVVERLGAETLVRASVAASHAIVARLGPYVQLQPGETVTFAVNAAKLHLFDLTTEQNLRHH
ncbi:ABC transporter family protein (plasmid) [Burkholderia pseudomallei]|uniref:ABC transporter ATP-binding protein n=1 Tax=Burkholderia pseudomallei TaxID=28450 RepID=UPI00050DF424|nr:sn-glycerol-3-phosphate ABC transporter ATP-binding protein UgpC [Burkholderia pseudomallei]AIV73848.1 ABC transporter family protein [Burkholderia pseudomallei]KGD54743.1 ABC transporter family protein [Burkholderia pseudomallei]